LISKTLLGAIVLLLAQGSLAAKPTSLRFVEEVDTGKSVYLHYVVLCSNNKRKDISAWNNRKSWCLGKGARNYCKKKPLSAARKACAGNSR